MAELGRMEANSFDDVWKKVAGESWSRCCTSTVPTDILIDEVQILYGNPNFFLRDIKDLVDHPNPNIRVLLNMCSYRPRGVDHYPPFDFPTLFGLEWLCLKRTEFDQLVENFINFVFAADNF